MAEQISAVATPASNQAAAGVPGVPAPAGDPTVFKVLPDGTVLYKTYRQAEHAGRQLSLTKDKGGAGKTLSQTKYGDKYSAKDGQTAPYNLGDLVEFQLTGLIVVVVVLAGLSLICSALGRLMKAGEYRYGETRSASATAIPAGAAPKPSPAAEPGMHPGLSNEQLVVILAAAASEILESPVHVGKFRLARAKGWDWSAKGRIDLHSHRLK